MDSRTRGISRRAVVGAVALASLVGGPLAGRQVRAQGLAPLIPDKAVDGAARIFTNTDDRATPNVDFLVLAFGCRPDAVSVETDLNRRLAVLGNHAATPGTATPAAPDTAQGGTWLEAPASIDAAHVWRPVIATGSTVIRNTYLVLRDGRLVYLWATIAQLPDEAPEASRRPAGPDLLMLAGEWFGRPPAEGPLIDRLPGIDLLPGGYVERYHADDLAALRDGDATPAASFPVKILG